MIRHQVDSEQVVSSHVDVGRDRRAAGISVACLAMVMILTGITTAAITAHAQSATTSQTSAQGEWRGSTSGSARYAMFWSESNTWIVDTLGGALFRAPTLLALGPEGNVFEYKLEVHTERVSSERPYGELYRWVSLERYLLSGQHHDQLTYHFTPDQLSRETHDEHQILQFTGEYVTLIRWFYHQHSEAQEVRDTTVYTLALDGVQALPELRRAEQILSFTRRLYPQLIPQCLKADARMVRWELGGQRASFWMTLSPAQRSPQCPHTLSALRLSPLSPRAQGGSLSWRGETLYMGDEALYGGVVDALLDPQGSVALTLEGAKRDDERLFVPQINQLYERPIKRYLSIWRASADLDDARGRHVSFPKGVTLRRLDGARWLTPESPILQLLDSHFISVDQSCFRGLTPRRVERYRRPSRPQATGHLCAVQTQGRAWEGHLDLSAGISAQMTSDTLYLDLWVSDSDRTADDLVRLWVGDPRDPVAMTLTPRGVIGSRAIRAGVKLVWRDLKAKRDQYRVTPATPQEVGGYAVRLELPQSLVRGHLSLAVDDQDLGFPGASQRLWVIGQPRSEAVGDTDQAPKPERFESR